MSMMKHTFGGFRRPLSLRWRIVVIQKQHADPESIEMDIERSYEGDTATKFVLKYKFLQTKPRSSLLQGQIITTEYDRLGDCPSAVAAGDTVITANGRSTKNASSDAHSSVFGAICTSLSAKKIEDKCD
jgi:hypothetical protein